jgi:hypothetical protein
MKKTLVKIVIVFAWEFYETLTIQEPRNKTSRGQFGTKKFKVVEGWTKLLSGNYIFCF